MYPNIEKRNQMIEICCGSYQDGKMAWQAGVKRIELNSALSVGGLTPSLSSLIRLKKETNLKIICMVRPRAAGFAYDQNEFEIMFSEAQILLEHKADGIAFGFLKDDGSINLEYTKEMVDLIHSYHAEAVFHRAIDVCKNCNQAVQSLINLGVDRILTSGQESNAIEGKDCIKQLQNKYGSQIEVLAGSGINASNAKELIEYTGITQVHSSCKAYKKDKTTKSKNVSFTYLANEHELDYDVVDPILVKELIESIE